MSKHTPGPWKAEWVRWGDEQDLKVCDSRGALLTMNTRGLTGLPEMEANARLIAATPDLLDMLKYVADVCHKLANGAGIGGKATLGEIKERLRNLRDGTEAIIAKAEDQE